MTEGFTFRGLNLIPIGVALSPEELKTRMTFEGAISYERLKDSSFVYFMMTKHDLEELLEKLGPLDPEIPALYQIKGSLISSRLKDETVDGYYLPTQWGFIRVNLLEEEETSK
ncbi:MULTISPECIES: hypothetical protein [Enterococcus]|uniref:Uncharacterized protein n=1 Tax=Candidatus Enterococcus ferrettii TaxID=2815324 RepID=A0ABV0ELU4_9ENTE|nr:hypothetical protein [Enterococcus sp. 665A]MBO1341797.1 hypothetical protein [Enterococcus sp. 665A]